MITTEQADALAENSKPLFWYRPRSDGCYEGPLHNAQIERVRIESGGWVPLFTYQQVIEQLAQESGVMPRLDDGMCYPWDVREAIATMQARVEGYIKDQHEGVEIAAKQQVENNALQARVEQLESLLTGQVRGALAAIAVDNMGGNIRVAQATAKFAVAAIDKAMKESGE